MQPPGGGTRKPGVESLWRDPDWLAETHSWVDDQTERLGLTRSGAIEQPHVYPWSTVLRVPTTRGDLWFKANSA